MNWRYVLELERKCNFIFPAFVYTFHEQIWGNRDEWWKTLAEKINGLILYFMKKKSLYFSFFFSFHKFRCTKLFSTLLLFLNKMKKKSTIKIEKMKEKLRLRISLLAYKNENFPDLKTFCKERKKSLFEH